MDRVLGYTVLGTWNLGPRRTVSRSQVIIGSAEAGRGTAQIGTLLRRVGGGMNGRYTVHLCHSEDQTRPTIGRGVSGRTIRASSLIVGIPSACLTPSVYRRSLEIVVGSGSACIAAFE